MNKPAKGRALDVAMLLGFSGLWSTGYVLIAVADDSMPPVTLTAIRAWMAAVVLVLLCLALRRPLGQAVPWHPAYLTPAVLIASFPWALTAEGEHYIDAGLTALMTSLTPLSTFVISAWLLRTEHSRWYRITGLLLSLFGLAMAIGFQHLLHAHVSFVGLACVASAFVMYGVNGILVGKWGKGLDPLVVSTYGITYGAMLITAVAFLIEDPFTMNPTWEAWAALAGLGCLVTAGGYALYFITLDRAGPLFASTWGYLVPAFGIIVSAVWLGTPLGWERIIGTILVVAGVFLVNLKGKPKLAH